MIAKILKGLGGGIMALIMFAVATITTFAIPVLAILWLGHLGPFSRSEPTSNSIGFCSTLNEMTNYADSHPTPKTTSELQSSLEYSNMKFQSVKSVPSDISGTVNAAISTSNKFLSLLQIGVDQGWTNSQRQDAVKLGNLFDRESSTLNKWYQSNC